VPYSAESDDLEETFPLMGDPDHLPKVAHRTSAVLKRYEQHRLAVRRHGVTAGHARLALQGSSCQLCGLCMTGCPYQLIYSASQTFDELRARGRVDYQCGIRVHRIEVKVTHLVKDLPPLYEAFYADDAARKCGCDRFCA